LPAPVVDSVSPVASRSLIVLLPGAGADGQSTRFSDEILCDGVGAIAVAVRKVGGVFEMPVLDTVSLAIILGAALLVSGAVTYSAVRELRNEVDGRSVAADV
jgi:hypothetical protein